VVNHHFKTSASDVLQICGACYGDVAALSAEFQRATRGSFRNNG
jgi:hypothetical protein